MIIKKGTLLYHGTIYNFEPTEINTPCWFSTIKEQAILHVCYKHYNNPNGMLMIYRLNQDINVVDLTLSGNERLFVNAYGNYALADNIKSEGIYQGYINFPEQSEIMLVNNGLYDFVKQIWDGVNDACAGYYNFDITTEHERPHIVKVIEKVIVKVIVIFTTTITVRSFAPNGVSPRSSRGVFVFLFSAAPKAAGNRKTNTEPRDPEFIPKLIIPVQTLKFYNFKILFSFSNFIFIFFLILILILIKIKKISIF